MTNARSPIESRVAERTLSITVRASASQASRELVWGASPDGAPALAELARLERTGDLKGVTMVSRAAERLGRRRSSLGMLAGALAAAGSARESAGRAHEGELLLEFADTAKRNRFRRALERRGDRHVDSWSAVPARNRFPMALSSREPWPGIRIPPVRGWNLERIGVPALTPKQLAAARGVHVAVLDTGVDRRHPSLAGRIGSYVHEAGSADDVMGHGTHVCGVIAARALPPLGVGGVCAPRVSVWKIYDDELLVDATPGMDSFVVSHARYVRALYDCLDHDVDVINLSFGGRDEAVGTEREALTRLLEKGVTIVAPMGNYRLTGSPVMYPAAVPGVIAVGASTFDDDAAPFSSTGEHISLSAPGQSVWSTLPRYPGTIGVLRTGGRGGRVPDHAISRNTHFDCWDCTSAAAPHVTAAAALLIGSRRWTRGEDVRRRLMRTAIRPRGMKGRPFTASLGAGRLDIAASLA